MKSPLRLIGFRLFLLLFAMMLVVFTIHTLVNIRTTSSNLTEHVYSEAGRASDLIVRSTRYSMLINHKEDVRQTIRTLGNQPGFIAIHVYNKAGEIIFSSDSAAVGRTVDLNAEACNTCHATNEPLARVPAESRVREYESASDGRVLGLINPINNEPACFEADCHAHSPDQSVLGVLDVKMSLASVGARVAATRRHMIFSSLVMTLIVAGISGLFIYRVIRNPIRRLQRGMAAVSSGDLDAKLDVGSHTEVDDLAQSFNSMALDLKTARDELRGWADTLQDRIAEKTRALEKAQSQVIHMEKMASLGTLSASVAHEINNPLFGILAYARLILSELDDKDVDVKTLEKYADVIRRESSRCGDIVKNLLEFSRQSGGEFAQNHVNQMVEQVLLLLNHHFEMKHVTVETALTDGDDLITCDAKQFQQAIIAPCINAVEAMSDGGTITVKTSGSTDTVSIVISDTGCGIPENVLPHVFEPFFTTKEGESGLGMGLAVVYGIVRRHGGSIDIDSRVNEGTTVTMTLPRNPAVVESEGQDARHAS